jgi:hypothetical protein
MARAATVPESRLRIERRPTGLHVALARRRPWWRFAAPAWIALVFVLGLVGMLSGAQQQSAGGIAFMVAWFGILLSLFALSMWGLLAREELVVDGDTLTRIVGVGPLARRRPYLRSHIEDLRLSPEALSLFDPRAGLRLYGVGAGAIAFDYGDRTIRVADVEEAQAKRVVAALKQEGL